MPKPLVEGNRVQPVQSASDKSVVTSKRDDSVNPGKTEKLMPRSAKWERQNAAIQI